MPIPKEIPEKILKSREACLDHADDLIRSANRILSDEKLPNISYHLAVLALEEIGKSSLIVMGYFANQSKSSSWNPEKLYDDHIKKLFWATWAPTIGQEKLTKKQITSLQGLSRTIHSNRLQALYVDFDSNGPLLPSDAISKPQAVNLINIATARLGMEREHRIGNITNKNLNTLNWFLSASSDSEKRKLIFGGKSMEKLSSLGSTTKWINWLKIEFDQADEEAKIAMEKELQRTLPVEGVTFKDKWKIKIRLFTSSHSIRPKPLNKWNKLSSFIQLYPVGGKKNNQLILELTLPENISIHQLWHAAWEVARKFVVALNIGSLGCFWWYIPEHVSHFYDKIIDLDNKEMGIKLERNPILKIDWKQDVLSDSNLMNTALCFGMISANNKTELSQSMDAYITALAFLNKNDIHLQLEINALKFFYESLKLGMKHFNDWDETTCFSNKIKELLEHHNLDENEIINFKKISEQFELNNPSFDNLKISLSEVAVLKVICDAYFILQFRKMAKETESS